MNRTIIISLLIALLFIALLVYAAGQYGATSLGSRLPDLESQPVDTSCAGICEDSCAGFTGDDHNTCNNDCAALCAKNYEPQADTEPDLSVPDRAIIH